MTSTTQPIIALAIKHGASSYTNRADTQHPAYGFTEAALTAFAQDLLAGQCLHQIAEPAAMTRYCPECGHVGEVSRSHRDCCPDGSHAFKVPAKYAADLRKGFKARLSSAQSGEQAAPQAVQAAVPEYVPLLDDDGRAIVGNSHHYTEENIRALVTKYKAIERGDPDVLALRENEDWRTEAGVLHRVIAALADELPFGSTAPAHPAEGVPAPMPVAHPHHCTARTADGSCEECEGHSQAMAEWNAERTALAATHPTQQGLDAQELLAALGDLSFACFGGIGTKAPDAATYNRTFAVFQKHRDAAQAKQGGVHA